MYCVLFTKKLQGGGTSSGTVFTNVVLEIVVKIPDKNSKNF